MWAGAIEMHGVAARMLAVVVILDGDVHTAMLKVLRIVLVVGPVVIALVVVTSVVVTSMIVVAATASVVRVLIGLLVIVVIVVW